MFHFSPNSQKEEASTSSSSRNKKRGGLEEEGEAAVSVLHSHKNNDDFISRASELSCSFWAKLVFHSVSCIVRIMHGRVVVAQISLNFRNSCVSLGSMLLFGHTTIIYLC